MSRVLLLVVLVLGIAASVSAGPNDNWIIYLRAADASGGNYVATACEFGTKTGATDSPAEAANDTNSPSGSGKNAVMGCFDLGRGTYGNGYCKDMRAPFDPISHPLPAWDIHMWLQPNWKFGDLYVTGWNLAGSYALNGVLQMALQVVSDPTGSYAPGTVLYTFGTGSYGTSSAPQFTAVFHNPSSIINSGNVNLQLVYLPQASHAPEPSSILSLMGLVGAMSGLVMARRKHAHS